MGESPGSWLKPVTATTAVVAVVVGVVVVASEAVPEAFRVQPDGYADLTCTGDTPEQSSTEIVIESSSTCNRPVSSARVVSQDDGRVVVEMVLEGQPCDPNASGDYPALAELQLDAPLNGREVWSGGGERGASLRSERES